MGIYEGTQMNNAKIIIVDIDGTLANIDHRRHLVEGEKKDWGKFNSEIVNDKPNELIVELLNKYEYKHKFIFVSGRQESSRVITTLQINAWLRIRLPIIYMRENDDFRPDVELKKSIYDEHLKQLDISFAIDDNKAIADLWRSLGIFTFDCAGFERN